jgi:uncharacterized protein YjbK
VPQEREFKYRIPDERALERLAARLGGPRSVQSLQRNVFFDTPRQDLRARHLALRLRDEEGAFSLTLKGPAQGPQAPLASREEEERALGAREAQAILEGALDPLEALLRLGARGPLFECARELVGREPVQICGGFDNERTRLGPLVFPPGSTAGHVFELDRTRFPDGSLDFELELELAGTEDPGPIAQALEALLRELGIAPETAPSKAARLFRILDARSARRPSTTT